MQKSLIYVITALLLASSAVSSSAAADRGHDRNRGHARGHVERWHGDIHRFRQHDMDRWRGGHWYQGRHAGRLGWWWIVAGAWYFYPTPVYPYPDPYLPPAAVPNPPAAETNDWYYCPDPPGYYPYVPQCSVGWERVPATPYGPPPN